METNWLIWVSLLRGIECEFIFDILAALFSSLTPEQKESALRSYLLTVAGGFDNQNLRCLLEIVQRMVAGNILPARYGFISFLHYFSFITRYPIFIRIYSWFLQIGVRTIAIL